METICESLRLSARSHMGGKDWETQSRLNTWLQRPAEKATAKDSGLTRLRFRKRTTNHTEPTCLGAESLTGVGHVFCEFYPGPLSRCRWSTAFFSSKLVTTKTSCHDHNLRTVCFFTVLQSLFQPLRRFCLCVEWARACMVCVRPLYSPACRCLRVAAARIAHWWRRCSSAGWRRRRAPRPSGTWAPGRCRCRRSTRRRTAGPWSSPAPLQHQQVLHVRETCQSHSKMANKPKQFNVLEQVRTPLWQRKFNWPDVRNYDEWTPKFAFSDSNGNARRPVTSGHNTSWAISPKLTDIAHILRCKSWPLTRSDKEHSVVQRKRQRRTHNDEASLHSQTLKRTSQSWFTQDYHPSQHLPLHWRITTVKDFALSLPGKMVRFALTQKSNKGTKGKDFSCKF